MWIHFTEEELTGVISVLRAAGAETIADNLYKTLTDRLATKESDEAYIQKARMIHVEEGTLEIDDGAVVSVGNEGAYVMAWAFVDNDEDEEDEDDEDGGEAES